MTIQELHKLFTAYPTICTDTRKITSNCLFFALKGDLFNGNTFAANAIEKGAKYAIIDEEEYATEHTIVVPNVLETLQQLANYHRQQSKATVISLTGSNGKTTTKELINAVLSTTYKTIATKGNLNNHIGVPLTLLSITPETEIAIVEMGANHQKEIAFLCSIAQPDFGYITNFGKAHLEGFGGVEGIIKGKSELYDYLIQQHEKIFFNADDPIQLEKLAHYSDKIGFSSITNNHYHITLEHANPFVTLKTEDTLISSQLIGSYNFTNCCAAILIGTYFKVSITDIKKAIEQYAPQNNRSQILKTDKHLIVLDAYNANPTSMEAALNNFKGMDVPQKILFLGDMFELGEASAEEHQYIANLVCNMNFDKVYLIGEHFFKTQTTASKYRTFDDLKNELTTNPLPKSNLLIKGSRGMALERILDIL